MEHKEIEVRFLEIDKPALIARLRELNAEDLGEELLEEVIVYDESLSWRDSRKVLRVRTRGEKVTMTYKQHKEASAEGTEEIELDVSDKGKAVALLERLGFVAYRHQEKYRHTFRLGEVMVDIDTWPKIPTYVELEGPSEDALREAAQLLGLDWAGVTLIDAKRVIEEVYHIPVGHLRWFTFDRIE